MGVKKRLVAAVNIPSLISQNQTEVIRISIFCKTMINVTLLLVASGTKY